MSKIHTVQQKIEGFEWETHREVASKKPSSETSMCDTRKILIRKSLDHDIMDVRTYQGYKGDLLVEFTTLCEKAKESIASYAEALSLEVVIKRDPLLIYKIYCIVPGFEVYDLK